MKIHGRWGTIGVQIRERARGRGLQKRSGPWYTEPGPAPAVLWGFIWRSFAGCCRMGPFSLDGEPAAFRWLGIVVVNAGKVSRNALESNRLELTTAQRMTCFPDSRVSVPTLSMWALISSSMALISAASSSAISRSSTSS